MRSLLLLVMVPSLASAQYWDWFTYTEPTGTAVQRRSKAVVDPATLLTDSFNYDATNRDLRWCRDGAACQTLDGAGGPNGRINGTIDGECVEAISFQNEVHVFYVERPPAGAEVLRHAWHSGGSTSPWYFEMLDGPAGYSGHSAGGCPSAAVFDGRLLLSYYDGTVGDLRMAMLTPGVGWNLFVLDGYANGSDGQVNADVGRFSSVVDLGQAVQVFYTGSGKLRVATRSATSLVWTFATLDGNGQGTTWVADARVKAVAQGGRPHVFYASQNSGTALMHAWLTVKYLPYWVYQVMDSSSASTGLDVDAATINGSVHVVYYDATNGDLRHAKGPGNSSWTFVTLDGHVDDVNGRVLGDVGRSPTILFNWPWYRVFYDNSTNGGVRALFGY